MTYNYHTHTFRCNHATETEREYIETAIKGGITHMGFSDHAPFIFPDGYESGFRVPTNLANDYFSVLSALREEYKDKISIHIGFEMECYPKYFKEMLKNVYELGAEYLILGHHFTNSEHPGGTPSTAPTDSSDRLAEYADSVVRGIESEYFTYVAHPDIFNFTGDTKIYTQEMRKICKASKYHNIPLEINFLGIRGNRHYPNEEFWKIAGKENSPVTFGFDAHSAVDAYDAESLLKAEELVRKYNLNYIGKPTVILLQDVYKPCK